MKTLLFSLAILFCACPAGAQTEPVSSGKITYEEKVKIEIKLEGEASALAQDFPRERKSEKVLTFTAETMLFEDGVNIEDDKMITPGHGDGNVRIRMVSGENKTFTDLKERKVVDQRDFMNRIFLVEKDLAQNEWKISGKQKTILGYNCIEATKTDTAGIKTTAWFAPSINVSGGPAGLGNLPGMILEADINNGSRIYTAKSVTAMSRDEVRIQKPKEGKEVTEDEYKKIVAAKLKEMGIEEGAGGNQMRVVIRHQ